MEFNMESRQGAVAGYLGELPLAFRPEDFEGQEWPMLIWLRGDEPICEEFNLDAETVMAELGIKRSRLTQIAGKELRVARMRVGRYVRPVFRRADVEQYKSWIRATASHMKSSRAIEEAAAKLEQETSTLADKVAGAAHAEIAAMNERMLHLHQSSQRLMADFTAEMLLNMQHLRDDFLQHQRHQDHMVQSSIEGGLTTIEKSTHALKQAIQGRLQAMSTQQLAEMQRFEQRFADLNQKVDALTDATGSLLQILSWNTERPVKKPKKALAKRLIVSTAPANQDGRVSRPSRVMAKSKIAKRRRSY